MNRPTKRETTFAGLPINVEIERGDTKSGVDESGQPWEHTYQHPYGEIQRTEGEDGDPVDVYLGPETTGRGAGELCEVFVVHQLRMDGTYDEDKVLLGFESAEAAEEAYRTHGPPHGFGSMDRMTLDQFKNGYLAATRALGPETHDSQDERQNAGAERYGSR